MRGCSLSRSRGGRLRRRPQLLMVPVAMSGVIAAFALTADVPPTRFFHGKASRRACLRRLHGTCQFRLALSQILCWILRFVRANWFKSVVVARWKPYRLRAAQHMQSHAFDARVVSDLAVLPAGTLSSMSAFTLDLHVGSLTFGRSRSFYCSGAL